MPFSFWGQNLSNFTSVLGDETLLDKEYECVEDIGEIEL
jgi:hypothetical protein